MTSLEEGIRPLPYKWTPSYEKIPIYGDPLKTGFSSHLPLTSRMEKYVYNVGRYLQLRFPSAFYAPFYGEDASTVCMIFKEICGLSEEYRRSTWYWTAELERSGRWQEIQEVLEPLVKQSVEQPSMSWSHERCIVRLVNALMEQDQDEKARQLLVDIQRSYTTIGKRLQSVDRHPLLSPRTLITVGPNPCSTQG